METKFGEANIGNYSAIDEIKTKTTEKIENGEALNEVNHRDDLSKKTNWYHMP